MISQQGATTAQPPATPATLRAQINATQVSLDDALARRAGILARIDAAPGPGVAVRLRNGELRGVDGQIARLRQEMAGLQAELRQREAIAESPPIQPAVPQPTPLPVPIIVPPPAPPAVATTVVPSAEADPSGLILGGMVTLFVLAPLAFAVAWRIIRRGAPAGRRLESEEDRARLARMEEAINAIALDVDRLSESQRFLTNALVAEARQAPVREELSLRS
jgi:hypothetical protein